MQKIVIATFSNRQNGKRTAINGMIEPLLSYFLPHGKDVDIIDGNHPGSSHVTTLVEEYRRKSLTRTHTTVTSILLSPILMLRNKNGTQISFKLRDFFSTLEWGFRAKKNYDLFIGLESIYTIAGILLRTLGKTKRVVYYVSDYSPTRYGNTWFNKIYLLLDRFCAKHSDYIWDVSEAIQKGRIQGGLDPKKSAPVIIVHNALFPFQITPLPKEKCIPYSLVFAGTLGLENGPDIAIKAVKLLYRQYPTISLHMFGGNEEGKETVLKELVQKLQLSHSVQFHGFINNAEKLSKTINKYMIGLAPYKKRKNSVRAFGDATKLRLYMGAGLPAVTTDVPPLGKLMEEKGSVLITKDNEKEFAMAIKKLFDNTLYQRMKKKSVEFARHNTWESTYASAFSAMDIKNLH